MSVNTSIFPNDTLVSSHGSSSYNCFLITLSSSIFSGYYIAVVFTVVPLSILILYYGLQHWQQNWSPSMAANVSHSDYFTYHLTVMELFGASGSICCCYGIYKNEQSIITAGDYLWCLSWFGETMFQLLTCLEHYLAVVHPIIYQNLRKGRGIQIRNKVICVVWLSSVALTCSMIWDVWPASFFNLIVLALVFFCNLSVLFVLIRPSPGEKGWIKKNIDQQKLRAFCTILAILIVLVLRSAANIIWFVLTVFEPNSECVFFALAMWLALPGSLLLPLLFVHKAVKRVDRNNAK